MARRFSLKETTSGPAKGGWHSKWLLAAACEVYLAARGGPVTPLSAEEIASWRAVGDELLPRLWLHLRRR